MPSSRASMRRATRRRSVAASMTALLAVLALAAPVSAAAQSKTVDRTITASPSDLGGSTYHVSGVISGFITVTADAAFTQPIRETLAYDDGALRQGSTLPVNRSVSTNGPGNLHVVWHVTSDIALVPNGDLSANAPCTLDFDSPVNCDAESAGIRIFGKVPVPFTPFVDLKLQAHVTVTPDAATVVSTELAGAATIGGPASQNEPGTQNIDIPCTTGKGDSLSVSDDDYNLLTDIGSTNGPLLELGGWLPILIPPFIIESPTVPIDLGPQHAASFTRGIGDGTTKVSILGAIAANNVPPSTDVGGPYSGQEGTAIHFDGSGTTSVCGTNSLAFRWDFSDGGVAFGQQPFHTFQDNGIFSGQLTATDPTGLSNTVNFSITVSNQNPAANAGPDTSADWGRLVAFNGQATDPGAGDQSTLQYSWDFGDGSPSSTGGPSVFHAYASPGDYVATLTVTDKDGGSDSDTRSVHVTMRDTVAAYLGATAGTYDTAGLLSASLVDEYGVSLNGKSIAFSVGGASAGAASTNSSGIASRAYTPLLNAGLYATSAAFAGDALYNPSSDAGSITIAAKATSVTYTGALTGGPNKTVTLSAILADATGTRLGGRTVVFALGTQTKSAVTDANGVATTTLKLTQKNGTYPLTATFTPAGTDAGRYLGSGDATTFKLQAK